MMQAQSRPAAQQALGEQLSKLQDAAKVAGTGKPAQRRFSAYVLQFLDCTAGLLISH